MPMSLAMNVKAILAQRNSFWRQKHKVGRFFITLNNAVFLSPCHQFFINTTNLHDFVQPVGHSGKYETSVPTPLKILQIVYASYSILKNRVR